MDVGVASIIIAVIQLLAKIAEKQGLSSDEIDNLFKVAIEKAKTNDPILLPDAVLPLASKLEGE